MSREIHLSEPPLIIRNKRRVLIISCLVGERRGVTRDPSLAVSFICKVRRFQHVVISEKYDEHMKDVCVFLLSSSLLLMFAASPQEREFLSASSQGAGFTCVSGFLLQIKQSGICCYNQMMLLPRPSSSTNIVLFL